MVNPVTLGLGRQFIKQRERWLKQQGVNQVLIQCPKDAYHFFQHQGYAKMPFNGPDGCPADPRELKTGKTLQ